MSSTRTPSITTTRPTSPSRTWPRRPASPVQGRHLLGPAMIVLSLAVGMIPFAASAAVGSDALGLGVGMMAIVTMAWGFTLSLRLRRLETLFGGVDRMYVMHRWLGGIAVAFIAWHALLASNTVTMSSGGAVVGFAGAPRAVADLGNVLAVVGAVLLLVLALASAVRFLPWRWWRWTHKLMGVVFVFASFHVWTADKPFSNWSGWGVWFGVVMIVGSVAWIWTLLVRGPRGAGRAYRVTAATRHEGATELQLTAQRSAIPDARPGQFVYVRLADGPLGEAHPFSLASAPGTTPLRVLIGEDGDWTGSLSARELVGTRARVEGPFGRLRLRPADDRPVVWFAAGAGVTPFLSDLGQGVGRPHLIYSVRGRASAFALAELERADALGAIRFDLVDTLIDGRLTVEGIEALTAAVLRDAHVVASGPSGFVELARRAARRHGAHTFESERFDVRGGFGPAS